VRFEINSDFDRVLEMVKEVNKLGLEVCCTLGMVNEYQAQRLAEAGLYAYNHNIDTSEEHYHEVITTRTYDDRRTRWLMCARQVFLFCSGGIIGLGETNEDVLACYLPLRTCRSIPSQCR